MGGRGGAAVVDPKAIIPLAKTQRALESLRQAEALLGSACMELAVVVGLEADWKRLAAAEARVREARVALSKKKPAELRHEISRSCGCGCWELQNLLLEHGPKCPAFGRVNEIDFDPELCDPELCEPERRRILQRSGRAVAS